MENDDKQSREPQNCTLESIEYLEDVTAFWTVDDEGNPDVFIDYTDQGDFNSYRCECGETFEDWAKVKEHLSEEIK